MTLTDEQKDTVREFKQVVNMTPSALERWLTRDTSKQVGWAGGTTKSKPGGKESVGHRSGERIVKLKRTRQSDLTTADLAHMRKVIGYVKRHLAQRPSGDVRETRWRASLMNWGHDPLKD